MVLGFTIMIISMTMNAVFVIIDQTVLLIVSVLTFMFGFQFSIGTLSVSYAVEVLVDTSAAFASHPLVFQSNLFYRILLSSQEHFVCQTELFSFSKVGVFWLQG